MSKKILVVCISLVVVLCPTLNANMLSYSNGDRHCAMAQGQVLTACLHEQVTGLQPVACCDAIEDLNKRAETPIAREWLCKCFQEIVGLSRYAKLIGMPEQCGIPNTVPFDTKTDCRRQMVAVSSAVAPNSNQLLDWPKNDHRRFFHVVYRVGNLDRTIKFYTECFGMKLLRKRDVPAEKYSNAFMGFGPETSNFAVELTYNYGVSSYDIGAGFGHFALSTQNVSKMVETVRAKGGNVTTEPGPVKGGGSVIAFVKDPDGYTFELIQRGPTPEPFCQVMLRVGNLDRAIKFYEKALGMRLLSKIDRPESKNTMGMMGYAEENKSMVLALTYNYNKTEYTKGNAYAQIAIGTDDVYKSGEVVKQVNKELGGKITREPGPLPGIGTKILSFLDPDGWKTVLVDNKDFLKELK